MRLKLSPTVSKSMALPCAALILIQQMIHSVMISLRKVQMARWLSLRPIWLKPSPTRLVHNPLIRVPMKPFARKRPSTDGLMKREALVMSPLIPRQILWMRCKPIWWVFLWQRCPVKPATFLSVTSQVKTTCSAAALLLISWIQGRCLMHSNLF